MFTHNISSNSDKGNPEYNNQKNNQKSERTCTHKTSTEALIAPIIITDATKCKQNHQEGSVPIWSGLYVIARSMATKQSFTATIVDCFASLAMTVSTKCKQYQ
jgi:hypothetical protein